mgnify:CR=1 FL=1
MKVYTIIDTFNEGTSDEAYIVNFSKKEDAVKFFDKYLKHYTQVYGDVSDLFDSLVSNGHCWDYVSGNEIGHIFIRNEEVNLEFRDDILPFEENK